MADLEGKTIAATYESLLNVGTADNQKLDGTPRVIADGAGNASKLYLADDSVLISGDETKLFFYDNDGGEHIRANDAGYLFIAGEHGVRVDTGIFDVNTTSVTMTGNNFVLLDGGGVLELNSSGGAIGIGNDANAYAMNIGTGAAARVITIGNVTGATQLVLNAGTAGIALASTGAGDITINSDDTLLLDADGVLELNSSAGIINIGNDDDDFNINIGTQGERTINIGTGSFADEVVIGNTTGASGVHLKAGTGDVQITGSLGIGVVAPAEVLSVVGNAEISGEIQLGTSTAGIITTNGDHYTIADGGTQNITCCAGGMGLVLISDASDNEGCLFMVNRNPASVTLLHQTGTTFASSGTTNDTVTLTKSSTGDNLATLTNYKSSRNFRVLVLAT